MVRPLSVLLVPFPHCFGTHPNGWSLTPYSFALTISSPALALFFFPFSFFLFFIVLDFPYFLVGLYSSTPFFVLSRRGIDIHSAFKGHARACKRKS
ncbi:hypothetical protein BDV29DRAFT_146429 [Aspergillus leporis]|uniref:Uncharacterized protein n=1 Tax=Aspergillus leporis TaxID=41062 RepID=A0A5N5X0B7_9EURO|nr:hypothetical protein BDV29DRAFT_146429 [Aspergillus leporis]